MTRKTKAEIAAEQYEQNLADWETLRGAWMHRVVTVILAACNYSYIFVVREHDGVVRFSALDERETSFYGCELPVTLPVEMNWNLVYELEYIERAIQDQRDRDEEARVLAEKRKSALNKLTPEDREVLGLT